MTEQSEPPQKLTRQERRHAEQKAAKRRSGDDLIAEDAEAYTAGAAYLATARTLYAQLSESVRRTTPLRRQVVRDASGTLDETWRSSFLVETQRWKSLTTQVQDLVPSAPVMGVHRRLQRCGADSSPRPRTLSQRSPRRMPPSLKPQWIPSPRRTRSKTTSIGASIGCRKRSAACRPGLTGTSGPDARSVDRSPACVP